MPTLVCLLSSPVLLIWLFFSGLTDYSDPNLYLVNGLYLEKALNKGIDRFFILKNISRLKRIVNK